MSKAEQESDAWKMVSARESIKHKSRNEIEKISWLII